MYIPDPPAIRVVPRGATSLTRHYKLREAMQGMSAEGAAPNTEAKEDAQPHRAPLRLMTQFLKAVSESRMEGALALAQTILTFEPQNAIILDYQATLAQYINNERELWPAREKCDQESSTEEEESSSATDEDLESETSTQEASGEEALGSEEDKDVSGASNQNQPCNVSMASQNVHAHDEQEEQRLGGMLRALRERRTADRRALASCWDEEKFAASQREVEAVLWDFLPAGAKQAAEKRAEDDSQAPHKYK